MATATAIPNAVIVSMSCIVEGKMVLETPCRSFNDYTKLPSVVLYEGYTCALTGWSSDKYYACYQSGRPVAYKK